MKFFHISQNFFRSETARTLDDLIPEQVTEEQSRCATAYLLIFWACTTRRAAIYPVIHRVWIASIPISVFVQ